MMFGCASPFRSIFPKCSVRTLLALAAICGMAVDRAGAQPDVSVLPGGVHVVDFGAFIGERWQTNGPVDLGQGVTWTATSEGWIGDMPFGLRTNGFWDGRRVGFAGLNTHDASVLFAFDEPVNKVGAFVNYAPLSGHGPLPTIEALDRDRRIIASVTIDIQTPNGVNEGRFLGFELEADEIYYFRYRARYGVLDDLTWSRLEERRLIPAPSSLAVMGAMLGLGLSRRRRSR